MRAMNANTLAAACVLLGFAACTGKPAEPAAKAPATPITPEVTAKLAAFDQKDGKVDKVVHLCAGCSLHMDGDEKFPLKVEDYTMHFCKQACLDKYQADPAKAILALQVK